MSAWIDDIRVAIAFLTRIPMPHPDGAAPSNFARAHRAFPMVGALIGVIVGAADLLLMRLGVPPLAAAAVALGASALLTGALHEDGLADLADGFGGGRDRDTKLEIMRDSRLGTYGAFALLVTFVAKVTALSELPPEHVVPDLIATHALARTPLTAMVANMPYARPDGLATSAGRPDTATVATSLLLALVIAAFALPWKQAATAILIVAGCSLCVAGLAMRQIGGQTGDVLGGTEQINETAILLLLAACAARS